MSADHTDEIRALVRPIVVAVEAAMAAACAAEEASPGQDGTILDDLTAAAAALARILVSPRLRRAELEGAIYGLAEHEPELRAALRVVSDCMPDDEHGRNAADRIILAAAYAAEAVIHPRGIDGRAIGEGAFLVLESRQRGEGCTSFSTLGAAERSAVRGRS